MKNIRVGCATMVVKDNCLLMGIRGKEPGRGKLIVPGGGVDMFEDFHDTAPREILEETGIKIKNLKQFKTYQIINRDTEEHRVIILWTAEYDSGELCPSSDLLTAKFYTREEIAAEVQAGNIDSIVRDALRDTGWVE